MGVDQEAIRKRFSQLEMDINNINKMIDDKLQISTERETEDDTVVAAEAAAATVEQPQTSAASGSESIGAGETAPEQQPAKLEESAADHVIDQTTDTSEDFTAGNVTTGISSNSSLSSPGRPETPIFIPKNGSESTTTLRRPTNPFRVISVGTPHTDATRKPSSETTAADSDSVTKLQKRLDYLTKKCVKLQKEIKYLNDMNHKSTLSIEDGRKLSSAIEKLQEYLDRKTKEKYDLGVLVSRQLRKEIDRGENGQFWIGTK
ncbi:hypothetical protein HG536_0G04280 [Torulaspora globosa]|uniref:Uncharacterized protein n=1 Tax=Torulaspora globosa TaxID=48254 RepID=A0A7G3ZM30_9SACH|nr:uncharacterized protein HG536_0G04280 [Torulaspora globosa]QLL34566.1 hypothetical protein HG536_0G04280 [Torulaspora globosa]